MTDPTPDQMRALAQRANECDLLGANDLLYELETALRAAADEVDRLRTSNAALQAAIQAIQLRSERRITAIENAPHDYESCDRFTWVDDISMYFDQGEGCTCWKADLL